MRQLVEQVFSRVGCPADEAGRIAHYLTKANLVGHDSHGVIRVPRYVEWLRDEQVFAGRHTKLIADHGTLLILDAQHGFGQTAGPEAAAHGIERAKANGVSVVALRRSGHLGRIGDFAEMAIAEGLISIHFVNVHNSLLVAPFGGRQRRFSTNPIAIGVPNPKGEDFILDFATSLVAEGKVLVAHQGGKAIPANALVDEAGNLTKDTTALYGNGEHDGYPDPRVGPGAIRTFGDHKGSGLALACELLAGALTGSGVNDGDQSTLHNGMLSFYLNPQQFDQSDRLANDIQNFIAWIRASQPDQTSDAVLIPGDPERSMQADREANGLPIAAATLEAILAAASSVGLTQDEINAVMQGQIADE